MAEYNTRGEKHNQFGKDYDCKYNKAVAWNPIFDTLVNERLNNTTMVKYSDHVENYDNEGNRTFDKNDMSFLKILSGDVVEIETAYSGDYEDPVEMIRKAVIRLPKRKDGEQVVVVADFKADGSVFIKTAWLNKASDNHQVGLDTTDIDRRINGKFGVYIRGALYDVYSIKNGTATKVERNKNNNKRKRR